MLQRLAGFSMQGRWQAATAIALLSVAAVMLPPLAYLSSGVVALATLRMGPKEGAKVVVAAMLICTLIAGLLLGNVYISGLFLISGWLPVLAVSLVLGYSRSLTASLLTAAGLGIVLVLGIHLVLSEPALWWQQTMKPFMTLLIEQPGWQMSQKETEALSVDLSKIMTGITAAGFSLNAMLGLLIGRAWQARLYNPGGFVNEFFHFSLGKLAAVIVIIVTILVVSPLGGDLVLLKDCLPVILLVFAVQGLSVIHTVVKRQHKSKFWLIAVYILLIVIMPQMVVLLAMTGVLEQWFNFRRRPDDNDE